jgi:hypothetical protein
MDLIGLVQKQLNCNRSLPNKGLYVTFYTVTDSLIEEAADPNVGNVPGLQEQADGWPNNQSVSK